MSDVAGSSRRQILATALALPAAAGFERAKAASLDRADAPRGCSTPAAIRAFSLAQNEPDLVVPLWRKGAMPGGPAPAIAPEIDDQWDNDGLRYRVAVHVIAPTLAVFRPHNPTGAAMLVIPGGGYSRVGIDREGYEVARWANSLGITAFVLCYRLPADRWSAGPLVALQDAQRAMRLIRSGNDGSWSVDPNRVTVLGGSAGGHLALSLCVKIYDRTYPAADGADHLLTRPDAAILLYPVVSMGAQAHVGSKRALRGDAPSADAVAAWSYDGSLPGITPPMLAIHAMHDRVVAVDHTLALIAAVRRAGGAIDARLYEEGAHGAGLRSNPATPMATWPIEASTWLARQASPGRTG